MKINECISRIRNTVKAVKSDAFLTDRYIYSLVLKHGYSIASQHIQAGIYRYAVFTRIPYIELEDVDKIPNVCNNIVPIYSNCTIKRSKGKIPKPMRLSDGVVIRSVASLDYSKKYFYIHPDDYERMMNLTTMKRWNKMGYYYVDEHNYLYLFNEENNNAVTIEGMFTDYSEYISCDNENKCVSATEFNMPFSDELISLIENNVLNELMIIYKIPQDVNVDDNKSLTK